MTWLAAVLLVAPLYEQLWRDPAIEQRIEAGIRANRMGFATLRFVDAAGRPATNVEVEIRQIRHDFLFGSNIFLLDGFPSAEQNRRYEDRFRSLFRFATAPFYWSDLEPEPGKLRFEISSPRIPRRPPPDLVLEFCRRHDIVVKGHPLLWHSWYPEWLPKDQVEVTRRIRRRFEQIAARYGPSIPFWDVVNEPMERPPQVILPKDYVYWAMREADRLFPADTILTVNEVTTHWSNFRWETSPFYLLLQSLTLRGARLDAIGLQFHLFSEQLYQDLLAGQALPPADLFRVLDQYADFQKPIHITEITIPTLPAGAAGEQDQATVTRNLYRLWFSHPKVGAITWWNLADGTAVARENKWGGGLLHEDLSPKPSWLALEELLQKQWRTDLKRASGPASELRFQGFYGHYVVEAKREGRTVRREIRLSKTGVNEFVVQL